MEIRNGQKIAITGKGGVGKSTITAALSLLTAGMGHKVLAIDSDPDANLASALGIPLELQKDIVTIAKHKRLIEERTGAKVQQYGQIFKLNPEVSDIADTYAIITKALILSFWEPSNRAAPGAPAQRTFS